MKKISIEKDNSLLHLAKNLRHNLTDVERRLWYDFLRNYPKKIYKQRIVGKYVVDFYCHAAKLVIELDGSQHYSEEGENYDKARTQYLNQQGLTVVRFSNLEVLNNFYGVCQEIDRIITEKTSLD